jgi:hypothetical protein
VAPSAGVWNSSKTVQASSMQPWSCPSPETWAEAMDAGSSRAPSAAPMSSFFMGISSTSLL